MKRNRKLYNAIVVVLALVSISIFLLVCTPLTNVLYALLEVNPSIHKADALILLTAAYYTDSIFDRNTYQRYMHCYDLYKNNYADKIIVCGGTRIHDGMTLAEAVSNVLVNVGVQQADIFVEESSQNTYENLRNTIPLLEKFNIKTVLLVTSSSHMFRSLSVSKKLGIDVSPAPVDCYEKDIDNITLRARFVLDIMREYVAIAYFWLRGWV
ncbi:MAG: YdcF family protein [Candidatus Omnitrophica bacterium]|nr:YdcF family protein [Candidatus Omnitrophota bacterium]